MVCQYVGFEFVWDVQLWLKFVEVLVWGLGWDKGIGLLGCSVWLNSQCLCECVDQFIMNVESICCVLLRVLLVFVYLD